MSFEYNIIIEGDFEVRIYMQYFSGMFQEYALLHHKDELINIMMADNGMKHYSITVK
jgi:hypothetical protein